MATRVRGHNTIKDKIVGGEEVEELGGMGRTMFVDIEITND